MKTYILGDHLKITLIIEERINEVLLYQKDVHSPSNLLIAFQDEIDIQGEGIFSDIENIWPTIMESPNWRLGIFGDIREILRRKTDATDQEIEDFINDYWDVVKSYLSQEVFKICKSFKCFNFIYDEYLVLKSSNNPKGIKYLLDLCKNCPGLISLWSELYSNFSKDSGEDDRELLKTPEIIRELIASGEKSNVILERITLLFKKVLIRYSLAFPKRTTIISDLYYLDEDSSKWKAIQKKWIEYIEKAGPTADSWDLLLGIAFFDEEMDVPSWQESPFMNMLYYEYANYIYYKIGFNKKNTYKLLRRNLEASLTNYHEWTYKELRSKGIVGKTITRASAIGMIIDHSDTLFE